MTDQNSELSEIRQALHGLFPDGRVSIRVQPKSGSLNADYRARIDLPGQVLNLIVESRNLDSRARLRDAIDVLRSHQAAPGNSIWILTADYVSPAMQERLREARAPFFDRAGNAWLVEQGVHLDRRGFANPAAETRLPRDPFSDKASLVLRALIDSEGGRGVRDLAEQLKLTPGYVSKVLQELDRRGYIARRDGGVGLRHADELLRDWVHAYRGHKPKLAMHYFAPATSARALMKSAAQADFALHDDYALTTQAGASLVHRYADFDAVEIYVREAALTDTIARQLNARPVVRGTNLVIMVPYYRASAFYGVQRVSDLAVVSDLQLYLDLYDFPVRGREQAERIYERRLAPNLQRLRSQE